MVKTFDLQHDNITKSQLALNPGDLSGDLVSGGTITRFSSTGIKDIATEQTLLVENNQVIMGGVPFAVRDGKVTITGNVEIQGVLEATTEVIYKQKYEKQFLQFANPEGDVGTGLLWCGDKVIKQLVFRNNPNRFFSSENIDMPRDRSYMIGNAPVISESELGSTITKSNLRYVGTLQELNVGGKVNIGDVVHFNPVSERFSIGTEDANGKLTVYDYDTDVELILSGNDAGRGVIGTYNTKGVDIVTDNQTRITIASNGDVTVGHEQKDSTVTRVYGKLAVGVKNPREQFEVAGNIRWANKLFTVGDRIPEIGNFVQGDTVWNSNPKPGAYIGWVCIVGGAPGQWSPFGLIA
jgi:hypothetical protein